MQLTQPGNRGQLSDYYNAIGSQAAMVPNADSNEAPAISRASIEKNFISALPTMSDEPSEPVKIGIARQLDLNIPLDNPVAQKLMHPVPPDTQKSMHPVPPVTIGAAMNNSAIASGPAFGVNVPTPIENVRSIAPLSNHLAFGSPAPFVPRTDNIAMYDRMSGVNFATLFNPVRRPQATQT